MNTVVLVISDNKLTSIMQAAGLFEPFKVIGKVITVSTESTPSVELLERYKKCESPEYSVVAVFFFGIPELAWRNPNIKVVSDGRNWSLLDNVLNGHGWGKAYSSSAAVTHDHD